MFEPILLQRAMLPRSETIGVYLTNGKEHFFLPAYPL